MVITLELPDDVFAVPKPSAQVAREVREAVATFWAERGELVPTGKERLLEPTRGTPLDFKALLLEMPDVGEDSDFARVQDAGRPDEPWGT